MKALPSPRCDVPPPFNPCLFNLLVASINPPAAAFLRPLKSFLFTPEGSLILPAQILLA
jgi:hypothetical protein